MPFIAKYKNNLINSLSISQEEFGALRGLPLLCNVCGSRMHIRYSKQPFRIPHFVHTSNSSNCHTAHISREHLAIQALIEGAINITDTWTAKLEYASDGWRGDVVAINNVTNDKISFEVQFSPITETAMRERTERQKKSGVQRTIWVCARDFSWEKEVPSVRLSIDKGWDLSGEVKVTFRTMPRVWFDRGRYHYGGSHGSRTILLSSFIQSVLNKELIARYEAPTAVIETGYRSGPRILNWGDAWHFQTREEVTNRISEKALEGYDDALRIAEQEEAQQRIEAKMLSKRKAHQRFLKQREMAAEILKYIPGAKFSYWYDRQYWKMPTARGGVVRWGNSAIILEPDINKLDMYDARYLLLDQATPIIFSQEEEMTKVRETYPTREKLYVWPNGEAEEFLARILDYRLAND